MSDRSEPGTAAEERFSIVFAHLGLIADYARSRGALDPDAIAAEVMTIAWRRLADVPVDDARPWLIVTARNLLFAQWRKQRGEAEPLEFDHVSAADSPSPAVELDPALEIALMELSQTDREALLLVAWEDLTPTAAAASLGISAAAFRVRLHRARRRLVRRLAQHETKRPVESSRAPVEEA